jgi:hypothetical protein
MVWEHQAFGSSPTATEVEECRRSAYFEARQRAFFYSFARPRFVRGRGRLIYYPRSPFGYYDPFFLEQDLFRFCLRAKGYRLVPARSADTGVGAPAPPEGSAGPNE